MKLQGKTALVTGGGTGMGRAICELFAAEGASVAINYRSSREAAEEVVKAIASRGGEAFAVQADVSKQEDVNRMVDEVDFRWGRLAEVDEVAKAALYLAADATATTGEVLIIDCGRTTLGPRDAAR